MEYGPCNKLSEKFEQCCNNGSCIYGEELNYVCDCFVGFFGTNCQTPEDNVSDIID